MSTAPPASVAPTCSPAAPARGPTTSAASTRPSRQHPRACGCAPSASRRYGLPCGLGGGVPAKAETAERGPAGCRTGFLNPSDQWWGCPVQEERPHQGPQAVPAEDCWRLWTEHGRVRLRGSTSECQPPPRQSGLATQPPRQQLQERKVLISQSRHTSFPQ